MSLSDDLREHAYRVAGGTTSDPTYDPETLDLECRAADHIEALEKRLTKILDVAQNALSIDDGAPWRQVGLEAPPLDRPLELRNQFGFIVRVPYYVRQLYQDPERWYWREIEDAPLTPGGRPSYAREGLGPGGDADD